MNENDTPIIQTHGSSHDIEILGQGFNYPQTWQGAIALVLIVACVTLVAISSIYYLRDYTPEQLKSIGSFFGEVKVKGKDNKTVASQTGFKIEFWTPSATTMDGPNNEVSESDNRWLINSPPEHDIKALNQLFGQRLKQDSRIDGYRRYKVYGEGQYTPLREGWWWVVGIDGEYSEQFLTWFAHTYKTHWGSPKNGNIYIEVTSSNLIQQD